jgi:hypothetical protein
MGEMGGEKASYTRKMGIFDFVNIWLVKRVMIRALYGIPSCRSRVSRLLTKPGY